MVLSMDKRQFLLAEHERILTSGQIFWPEWRSDFERFFEDILDMTPKWIGARYLGPREKALGIVPGNVEWHFKKQRFAERPVSKPATKSDKRRAAPKAVSASQKKKLVQSAKEERRKRIAEEFRRWEELQRAGDKGERAQGKAEHAMAQTRMPSMRRVSPLR
ncbi:hypothetical protein [Rhizobium sp.]|uniref:hypothetical protein n=1 Tax=Rhizobium sp. TaxID=391 RepID=UPI0028AAA425